jgi:hypothetical protein
MFDVSRDIHSLTDFKKNTSEFINSTALGRAPFASFEFGERDAEPA